MRRYKQFCGLAVALDLIGERWTMLIVRDLLLGPKRYSDLMAGLPGIGTNLLASRLKTLEEHDIVRQTRLPPPVGATVYELTEAGKALEEPVLSLARWGMRFFSTCESTDLRRVAWPVLALRGAFDPARAEGLDAVVRVEVLPGEVLPGEVLSGEAGAAVEETVWMSVRDGHFASGDGYRPDATIVARCSGAVFRQLLFGGRAVDDAIGAGSLVVNGDAERFQRVLRCFRFSGD